MIEKISDFEIEEILRDNPRKLTSISEIIEKLGNNRNLNRKTSVSKTTVYSKLEKMVNQKKLHHVKRKGYKLLNYEFTEKDPNFGFYNMYKKIINIMGFIWVDKTGNLREDSFIMDNIKDDLDIKKWNELKKNYKQLIEQGILELKKYYKKHDYFLSINYNWAMFHEICPVCLEKLELSEPHFMLEFVEDEVAYSKLTKTHIGCIESILNLYELKKEYESDAINYKEEEIEKIEISQEPVGFNCPYCGLTLDLYDLFFSGSFYALSKSFDKDTVFKYSQSISKELFGDFSTLLWAAEYRVKPKVRLVIKKIVIYDGKAFHPNCAILKAEDFWKKISHENIIEEG